MENAMEAIIFSSPCFKGSWCFKPAPVDPRYPDGRQLFHKLGKASYFPNVTSIYSPSSVDRIWLWVYSNKIIIYP